VVASNTAAPAVSASVVSVSRTPIDEFRSVQEITEAPASYPVRKEARLDETYFVPIKTERTIENVSDPEALLSETSGSRVLTEYTELDDIRSYKTTTTIDELPPETTWYGTVQKSFPDTLEEYAFLQIADFGWRENFSVSNSATGDEDFEDENETRTEGWSRGRQDISQFNYVIKEGYSGPVKARFTETFTWDSPSEQDLEMTTIQPKSFRFTMSASRPNPYDELVTWQVNAQTINIPPCLHKEIIAPEGEDATITILNSQGLAATTPEELVPGEWLLESFDVSRWKYNIWRTLKTEIQVPGGTLPTPLPL